MQTPPPGLEFEPTTFNMLHSEKKKQKQQQNISAIPDN